MLTYSFTNDYDEFVEQCDVLRQMNYLEVSAKRGGGYSFSDEVYKNAGEALRIVIAYGEGSAVGYHVCVVIPNPHDTNEMLAVSDMFFLMPEFRKGLAGVELLKAARADIMAYAPGARWRASCPIDGDRDFGVLLERALGMRPIERLYEVVLPVETDE